MLGEYLSVPQEIMFKEANIKEEIDDPRLANIYKAVHNKGRAERIARALQGVEEGVEELKDHGMECTLRVRKMINTLDLKVKEMALSIEI
jgi:hypothetical protein